MIKRVLVDTSFLMAYLNPHDPRHFKARALQRLMVPFVTSELVLIEFLNAFSGGRLRRSAERHASSLLADPLAVAIPCSHEMFSNAMRLYAERPDKGWSLTDCASFQIMEELRIQHVFTSDQDFVQAGFTAMMLD